MDIIYYSPWGWTGPNRGPIKVVIIQGGDGGATGIDLGPYTPDWGGRD